MHKAALWLVLALSATAQTTTTKLVDVRPYFDNQFISNGQGGGVTVRHPVCDITVQLDGIDYTARYYTARHFDPASLVVGDPIEARISGKDLVITMPDGKTQKSRIIRRAHSAE